jgi:putative DNA primase/helicase
VDEPREPPAEPPTWDELERQTNEAIALVEPWHSKLIWRQNSKGGATVLENHIVNVTEILAHDERWCGVIALNEFSQVVEIIKQPPHETPDGHAWLNRPVTDADVIYITNWLAHQYRLMARPDTVGAAIGAVGHRNAYHPVREYLDSLVWDGTERLSHWLEDYCGATATSGSGSYIREVARKWMISAVARIYRPGCKADHVLILEGATGIKKSTLFSVLGSPWFTDHIAAMGSKDAALQVQGVWIIELAELDVMSRSEVGQVKAFLSVSFDRIRPPYGRTVMRYDRQCVFAGTVNHTDYLRDETGNRRFWPVRCANDRFDLEALAASRDQLWAEAVVAYRAGENWWLEDERTAREEQADRMQGDPWDGPVADYLAEVSRESGSLMRDRAYVTLPGVMKALQIPIERQGQSEGRRIVSILKRMGWLRRQVRTEGISREWRYMAPEPESVEP